MKIKKKRCKKVKLILISVPTYKPLYPNATEDNETEL